MTADMTTQNIDVPDCCPECGAGVCVTVDGLGGPPVSAHCDSEHDGGDCEWSQPLVVDPAATNWVIVSRLKEGSIP